LYSTYVGERVVFMGIGGNSLLIYVLRTMGDWEQWERTMERVPIVLDNRLKEQCSALIRGTMDINIRQCTVLEVLSINMNKYKYFNR
jgi:hypothetical protein